MTGGLKLTHILLLLFAFFILWLPKENYQNIAKIFMSDEQKQALALRDFARSVGENCDSVAQCKHIMQVNCPIGEVSGTTHFYNSETLEQLVTCGDGSTCPPAEWDCEAATVLTGGGESSSGDAASSSASNDQLPDTSDIIIPAPIYTPDAAIPQVQDGHTPSIAEPTSDAEPQMQ